ncbi:urease accessory protein UreE [Corynebacterium halotolerans]|uniref:Urease accessory protein UreE n=1 Tax=Corynebacterium halotolerans YIM 70093 = DSM 44683 TaxID=1121362 RepID=M1NNM9_9CORY|nr:urease accessory protein UreE [Corynebacterium halotolerans]AGF72948.1 urease accessory protein UreE [Corynebacterium halotolerans YIM 70093 = DSM 44683]
MIITEILGNINDPAGRAMLGNHHIEKVVLAGDALVKRIQRVTTNHHTEIGVRLPPRSPDLRDGDILALPGRDSQVVNAIIVSVLPTDVLVIAPETITRMGFVAHSLGNRHLQAQFFDVDSDYGAEVMVVQYDHTVEDFLEQQEIPYARQRRIMPVPFRHADHSH